MDKFSVSPIVRLTLIILYASLTIPLPFLPSSPNWLPIGLVLGAFLIWGALGEQVILTETTIELRYPWFIRFWLRSGWLLNWTEIIDLKPRTTGQGGLVYYLVSSSGAAYLLPMRMTGFSRFVEAVSAKTGIDTKDVRPLAQPWMYFILFFFSLLLLIVDGLVLFSLPKT